MIQTKGRYRIALGTGFTETSHRLKTIDNYSEAIKIFRLVALHPRRTRYAELYFVQPNGDPELIAQTTD